MNKFLKINLIIFLSITFCSSIFAASATQQNKESELKQLNQKIQQLQQEIQRNQGQRTHVSKQLQKSAAQLAKLQKRVAQLNQELNQQKTTLKKIQKNQETNQQKFLGHQSFLAEELKAHYLLLTNDDQPPMQLERYETSLQLQNYISHIINERTDLMGELTDVLDELKSKQHKVIQQKNFLQNTLSQQQKTQAQLAASQQNQRQTLQQIDTQLQSKNTTLKRLLSNRRVLEKLLKDLAKAEQRHRYQRPVNWAPLPSGAPFTQLQGKLPWPTSGNIVNHFGESIEQSELKYTGVLIKAALNQPVRAVYQGRIVFANTLQGLGLLSIIDHGNGFMTLYGHNQSLYKKVGDIVKSGDVIATVGNHGSQGIPGVYFEIRHNGRALNPENWCR